MFVNVTLVRFVGSMSILFGMRFRATRNMAGQDDNWGFGQGPCFLASAGRQVGQNRVVRIGVPSIVRAVFLGDGHRQQAHLHPRTFFRVHTGAITYRVVLRNVTQIAHGRAAAERFGMRTILPVVEFPRSR